MTKRGKSSRTPKSHDSILVDVAKILGKIKIYHPPIPIERIAKALGAEVQYAPFDGELAGMLVRRHGKAVIGVNSLHHSNRQRFTIAHELGHLQYHEGEIHVDRKLQINRRDELSALAVDPDEIEANRFAAEILIPYTMIIRDLESTQIDVEDDDQIQSLALKYLVSAQAMTHRITNLLGDARNWT